MSETVSHEMVQPNMEELWDIDKSELLAAALLYRDFNGVIRSEHELDQQNQQERAEHAVNFAGRIARTQAILEAGEGNQGDVLLLASLEAKLDSHNKESDYLDYQAGVVRQKTLNEKSIELIADVIQMYDANPEYYKDMEVDAFITEVVELEELQAEQERLSSAHTLASQTAERAKGRSEPEHPMDIEMVKILKEDILKAIGEAYTGVERDSLVQSVEVEFDAMIRDKYSVFTPNGYVSQVQDAVVSQALQIELMFHRVTSALDQKLGRDSAVQEQPSVNL